MKTTTKKPLMFALSSVSLLSLFACGSADPQIVKNFTYTAKLPTVQFGVEFQKSLDLNTDLTVPIKNYGEIKIVAPYGNTGLQLVGNLNMDMFVDPEFFSAERTRFLPNGQDMSPYVQTALARVQFQPHDKIGTSLYLGLENPDKKYLGASIELDFIDQSFPQGLVISQRLKDAQDRPLGVITFYGPKVQNNQVMAPGGIFFVTNVSDLIIYAKDIQTQQSPKLKPDFDTQINEPYRKLFSNPRESLKLFDLYKEAGKKAQLID